MKDFKGVMRTIGFHSKVMLRGIIRTLYGAAAAGLVGMAVYGFMAIPSEGGYMAVFDFIGAIATLVVALSAMYAIGGGVKKGAKR